MRIAAPESGNLAYSCFFLVVVTIHLFSINESDRLLERDALIAVVRYSMGPAKVRV